MWISSLGWEDPLKEGMATHSTFFSGESHGQRSLAGYSPWGSKGLDMMSTHMRTPGTVAWELGPRASLSGNQPVKMLGPHSECQSLSPSSITLPAPSLKWENEVNIRKCKKHYAYITTAFTTSNNNLRLFTFARLYLPGMLFANLLPVPGFRENLGLDRQRDFGSCSPHILSCSSDSPLNLTT